MPRITLGDRNFTPQPGETVLECLQREGVPVASSCRAGACQSCLTRAIAGTPPPDTQRGLKDTQRVRGYFLPCITRLESDLTITLDDIAAELITAEVIEKTLLSPTVLRLRLKPQRFIDYHSGQFINLVRDDGLTRSYSVASVPGLEDFLELHVRLIPGGRMSTHLSDCEVGHQLSLRGPAGDCFYVEGRPEQPLLLAGAGTGLAPLYGIVRDALRAGHRGPIGIVHAARNASGLYMTRELAEFAAQHRNVSYVSCVMEEEAGTPSHDGGPPPRVGMLPALLTELYPKLTGWRVFLCGDTLLVQMLRKQVFLNGASRKDIAVDAFLMAQK